jgi:acylphosphatase
MATIGWVIGVSLVEFTSDDNRSLALGGPMPGLELWVHAGDHEGVLQVQYDIVFTGRVQGVGFRASTVNIAQGFAIAGWVGNEPDGSVRCVARGEAAELDRFVEAVKQAMARYVQDVRVCKKPAAEAFIGFHVRY